MNILEVTLSGNTTLDVLHYVSEFLLNNHINDVRMINISPVTDPEKDDEIIGWTSMMYYTKDRL
jgi:hypothetical protein